MRSNARLDHLQEGLDETITAPFPLTPEGVIDYLLYERFYDQEMFSSYEEITSITVHEEVGRIVIVVNTIQNPPQDQRFFNGQHTLFIDPFGKVIEKTDSYSPLSAEDYEIAYQEVSKVREYASLVTIR